MSNHTLYGRILEGWESSSVSGAYYFTNSESENRRSTMRKSFPVDGVELGYTEATAFRSLSNSHGLGLRGEFRFDSLNTILITPNLSSSRLHSPQSRSAMTTWDDSTTFSRISSSDDPVTTGTQLSGSLLWGHRFELPGRTFSVELKAGSDGSSASSILRREADAVGGGIPARDTLYQMRSDTRRSRRISGRAIYTEPLTAESRVAIDYQIRNSSDMSDTWTRSGSTLSEADANPDPASSGEMTEQIFSQRVGFGMQQQFGPLQMTAMLSHDLSRLRGEGTRPGTASASATYSTFLPRLRLKYAPGGGTSWELVILSDRNLPSIGELQEVIDNSNPLLLKKGNPDLRQSVGHGIKVTSTWGQGRASSHISIRASVARDVLGQSTFVLPRDSITSSGLRLLRGTQIVEPYNGGRSWRIEGDGYWYTPLISDYLHLTFLAKVSYSTQPWKWNDREYSSSSVALRPDITLLVSPNEDLWIRLGYQPDIHSTWGGSNGSTLRHIGSHEGDFTARWSVVKGVELKNSVRMRYDPAIPSSVSNDWITWNMECTVKLPGVKGGELLVGFYDILDRGRALERRISESFVEERSAMTYGRYLMLNLRYGWM